MPNVSVVVPSYNHAGFIEACLRSIFNQTLAPSQLVVIDDGSTDDSPRIIAGLLENCSFPSELVVRENRGLTATLNEALERTDGEYFAYLSSDDLWFPEFLDARVKALEARPRAVLAHGHSFLIDENNQAFECTRDWPGYFDGETRAALLRAAGPMSPTVVYRREPLLQERWDEEARLEDYDLYLRLSLRGEFIFDPKVLSAWRRHRSNTSADLEWMLREHIRALRKVGPVIGLGPDEVELLISELSFGRAADFLRAGDKSTAVALMFRNLKGAGSWRRTAGLGLRLLTPTALLKWRRNLTHSRFKQRYGTVSM